MKQRSRLFIGLVLLCAAQSLLAQPAVLKTRFSQCPTPPAPNYDSTANWAGLPQRRDPCDDVPRGCTDKQKQAVVDVFFIHPTSYTGRPTDSFEWNADLKNTGVNASTDKGSIRFQASIFNGSCRVFAPRYRQAHIYAFFTPNKSDYFAALDTAYGDVRRAFEWYLAHENKGRPVVIASHSQGTVHAQRLLREFFEQKPLKKQLVAAYLVGMPVPADSLPDLKPCSSDTQTGCFVSWRSFQRLTTPSWQPANPASLVCVNPLSWKLDTVYVPKSENRGAVLNPFHRVLKQRCDAQVHEGYLWVSKPKFPGSRLYKGTNYHVGDYNLFYMDVRFNVEVRINRYLSTH